MTQVHSLAWDLSALLRYLHISRGMYLVLMLVAVSSWAWAADAGTLGDQIKDVQALAELVYAVRRGENGCVRADRVVEGPTRRIEANVIQDSSLAFCRHQSLFQSIDLSRKLLRQMTSEMGKVLPYQRNLGQPTFHIHAQKLLDL